MSSNINHLAETPLNNATGYTTYPPTSTPFATANTDGNTNINPSTSSDNTGGASTTADSNLNPRSCVTCRRRKVRCNKREPCSNCIKAGIECVFPGPGRAPRKQRRPPDVEVLSRLRRLEGVVESLGGTEAIEKLIAARLAADSQANTDDNNNTSEPSRAPDGNKSGQTVWNIDSTLKSEVQHELGRLVIDDTKSIYMSDRLYTSLGNQVLSLLKYIQNGFGALTVSQIEELEQILESPSEEDEHETTPEDSSQSPNNRNHDAFLFGYSSIANTLRNYHPTPTQAFILYKTYELNVAPLLTVVHKPTVRNLIINAAMNGDSIDKSNEALLFAVYLAAVISMPPEQCLAELGDDRDTTISRFRFATEQALARANFLNSRNINLLQAAVLFISCVHKLDTGRFVWTMCSVILRLATGLGLHRDGTNFGLSPFETEMRRRLWWHIILVDVRTAEDHGTDPMINEWMYDTRMPLNINDDDITPELKTFPPERAAFTDMTFTMIRCHVSKNYRNLIHFPGGTKSVAPTLEDRKKTVECLHNTLNEKYVKYCDMQEPLQWACATMARLVVAKLWLVVHHPMIKNNLTSLSVEDRNRILLTSIEVIEFTRLMETSESTRRWSWLFGSYVQWHAIAFVLAELCVRPQCPGVERAWLAIDSTFHEWERRSMGKKGSLWRPLTKLYNKAQASRAKRYGLPGTGCPTIQENMPVSLQSQPQQQQAQPQQQQRSQAQRSTPDQQRQNSGSSSPYQRDGNISQFSSPGQTSDPNSSISATSTLINQTPSKNETDNTKPTPEFNLDLSKNIPDILSDFMPVYTMAISGSGDNNISNISNINNIPTTTSVLNTTTADMNHPTTSTFTPTSAAYIDPIDNVWPQDMPNAFGMPMDWEQFDDVMRDFQQEFEQVAGPDSGDSQIRFM
ncbi:Bikaverin cluster transcription factor bik5 [Talaromyces pinophilus]|nr:Bikaverin cluster transcription factor bik5 [Talaromyces pinophilus]